VAARNSAPRAAGAAQSGRRQEVADRPVEVLGIPVTHPGKLLWPADQITKLDLAQYYARVAPVMLRYVQDRPITLRPFPHGVEQPGFYLKNVPKGAPRWLETFADVAGSTGEEVHFVVARDARTLVWVAQFNGVEVHPWLARVDAPDYPDWAVVDLDPADEPDGDGWRRLVAAAHAVRRALAQDGLRSFPKLSGQSGLHVMVPLAPVHVFDDVRDYFARLALAVCRELPDVVTTAYSTAKRDRRILIDYAQNARAKTTVAPYSVRPKPHAPVSAPVTWDELDDPHLRPTTWTLRTLPPRLDRVGDLLEPALGLHQRLPRSAAVA
jgi:bifunctional non-homologous end joining protein LigD